jgi:alanyl-tRNA synthetase
MLGNWSLGDYFKNEQIEWIFTFLTNKDEGIGLDPKRLYVTVFAGNNLVPKDTESIEIWQKLFRTVGIEAQEEERIFAYDVEKNWWSRSGPPEKMPAGEPGGPDSEVFYDFEDENIHLNSPWRDEKCHVNCDCGRYIEIANSVFMQYIKQENGTFNELPQKNVDFGGGLERFLLAENHQPDVFKTSLFSPIIESIETATNKPYLQNERSMRIIADHLTAAVFIVNAGVKPSKNEQGYVLRRLIRRAFDNFTMLKGFENFSLPTHHIIETIKNQYKNTDPELEKNYEEIKKVILEEINTYRVALTNAKKSIDREVAKLGIQSNQLETVEIPAELAFKSTASLGLGPTQLDILGYTFDKKEFDEQMKKHRDLSRTASAGMFKGGLADHSEMTVMGHTATHLLHQALRDVLGNTVHQSGSNITPERIRFDFNFDRKLTDEEMKEVEGIINEKIKDNLPVHFELIPTQEAYEIGAIGLFMDTYGEKSKIYFIGDTSKSLKDAYSIEFCGGPHVDFTGQLKSFKIVKQDNLGKGMKRIYGIVNPN